MIEQRNNNQLIEKLKEDEKDEIVDKLVELKKKNIDLLKLRKLDTISKYNKIIEILKK
jgi:hypothetical protein